MKTEVDESKVPKFEDIVFEGRNKEYGAYAIREKYNSTVIWAIIAGVFIAGSAVVAPYVQAKINPPLEIIDNGSVIYIPNPTPIDEPLKPKDIEKPKVEVPKEVFIQPEVVDTIPEGQENGMLTAEDANEFTTDDSVLAINNKPRVEIDDPIAQVIEEPELVVDEEPKFGKGDANDFRYWVKEVLKYPEEAASNGIQGRVYVQFVIEKDGTVTNVKVIKSDDPLLDKEALRVVQLSPVWNPAKKQGRPVRKLITFPIIFKLSQI